MFKNTFSTSMLIVFLAANGILFYATGIKHDIEFWVSYGFVIFAYVTLWGSAFRQNDSSMEYLLALTRIRINTIYVLIALIASIILFQIDVSEVLLYGIQLAIAVVFIVLMLFVSDVDDRHAEIEVEVEAKTNFIHSSLCLMDQIRPLCNDSQVDRKVGLIIDMLMSSQSTPVGMHIQSESDFTMYAENLRRKVKMGLTEECIQLLDKMEKALDSRSIEISRSR